MARKDEENRLLKQQMEAIKNGTAGAGTQPASVASANDQTQGQATSSGTTHPCCTRKWTTAMSGNAAAGRKGAKVLSPLLASTSESLEGDTSSAATTSHALRGTVTVSQQHS